MTAPVELLESLAAQYGYLGVFAVSLAGSVVPFVPLPYLAVVVLMSGSQDPLALGLIAGVGAAVGKITSYALGRLGYLAAGDKTKRNVDVIHQVLTRYGTLGVFIFAVTPLPDDLYVIPMGIARLPFWRFFAADLSGKIVLSVFVAYLGRAYFSAAGAFLQGDSLVALAVAAVATAAASVVIARADWALAIEVAHARGLGGVVSSLGEILRVRRAERRDPEG